MNKLTNLKYKVLVVQSLTIIILILIFLFSSSIRQSGFAASASHYRELSSGFYMDTINKINGNPSGIHNPISNSRSINSSSEIYPVTNIRESYLITQEIQPTDTPHQDTGTRQVELQVDKFAGKISSPSSVTSTLHSEAAISLVVDDGDLEAAYGVNDSTYAYQFIWLNRFTPDPSNYPFTLNEIQVMFSDDGGQWDVQIGDTIDLTIYVDADGDPLNGATLLATYNETVQAVNGSTWSVYNLSPPLTINGPGDVLIAVINRFIESGVTPKTYVATIDQTTSQNRSYIGWWIDDPPDPAILPPDSEFKLMEGDDAGNWLIRGYGETTECLAPDTPVLISPPDGSGTADNTPTFDWNPSTNSTEYELQVDNNPDFSSPVIYISTAETQYTPSSTLSDGEYYWRVIGHNTSGGCNVWGSWSDPYELLISTAQPFDVFANWLSITPTIDGILSSGEWSDAAVYDITVPESTEVLINQDILEVLVNPDNTSHITKVPQNPEGIVQVDYSTVTLYVKNDAGYLYLAIDNPNDTSENADDQMGIYFDDNPLPPDGQWTNTYCGNPDGEGNFWILSGATYFREWISGPSTCSFVSPAPGINGSISYNTGHLQSEVRIDLNSSALRALMGDTIGMYIWIGDDNLSTFIQHGIWPLTSFFQNPATYGELQLACSTPAIPNLVSPSTGSVTADTTPTFDWDPSSYSNQYNLQVDNNSDFSSPILNIITTNTIYTPVSTLPDNLYYWRVRGQNTEGNCNTYGNWSTTWNLTVDATPPVAPTLVSPTNGTTINDDTPTFDWNDVSSAVEYQLLVDNNSDFSSPLINAYTNSSIYTSSSLSDGTYYWRVRARDSASNWGSWSPTWSFTINTVVCVTPGTPNLISPSNGSITNDNTPTFDWDPSSDSSQYNLQVDNNSDFSSPAINTTTTSTAYTTTSALSEGTYYWRVRGHNTAGGCNVYGTFSSSRTITIDITPPVAPTLVSPTNGTTINDDTPTFDWNTVSSATQYNLLVDNNSDFSSPLINAYTSSSIYTTSPLSNGKYYWRVRARDSASNWGSWSATWNVTIQTTLIYYCYLPVTVGSPYFKGIEESEPNNDRPHANGPLEPGKTYQGYPNDQWDFFSIQLILPGSIHLLLENYSIPGGYLILYYEEEDDQVGYKGSPPYEINLSNQPAGWYYIAILTPEGHNSFTPYYLRADY